MVDHAVSDTNSLSGPRSSNEGGLFTFFLLKERLLVYERTLNLRSSISSSDWEACRVVTLLLLNDENSFLRNGDNECHDFDFRICWWWILDGLVNLQGANDMHCSVRRTRKYHDTNNATLDDVFDIVSFFWAVLGHQRYGTVRYMSVSVIFWIFEKGFFLYVCVCFNISIFFLSEKYQSTFLLTG